MWATRHHHPAAHPTTLGQLRDIPGIGDKKLERYGADLLALVAAARPSG